MTVRGPHPRVQWPEDERGGVLLMKLQDELSKTASISSSAGAGLGGTGAAFEAQVLGPGTKKSSSPKRRTSTARALWRRVCTPLTATWVRVSVRTTRKTMFATPASILMGMVREDLLFDMARHVDSTVHQFEEWGLPLMRRSQDRRVSARRALADHDPWRVV